MTDETSPGPAPERAGTPAAAARPAAEAEHRSPGECSALGSGPGPAPRAGAGYGQPGGVAGTSSGAGHPVPLLRSRRHRVIAGVCAGLGRYFDIDPVIFRVVLAVLTLTGGLGLLAYGMAWLLIPAYGKARNEAQQLFNGQVEGPGLAALLFALAGSGLFLTTLGRGGGEPFFLLVIGAVAGAVYLSQRRRAGAAPPWAEGAAASGQVPATPPAAQPPPSPPAPSWWHSTASWSKDPTAAEQPAGARPYPWGPDDETPAEGAAGAVRQAPEGKAAAQPKSREPRSLFGFALFLLASAAWLIGARASWSSPPATSLQIAFACALAVLGTGLVGGSLFGKPRSGTVLLALVTAALLAGSAALPANMEREWRRRNWKPADVAEVRPEYRVGTGLGTLDLTGLDPGGRTVRTRVEVGVGLVRARLPAHVRVEVRGRSGLGVVRLAGDGEKDVDVALNADQRAALEPAGPESRRLKGLLILDLEVGVGQVEVAREAS